MKENSKASHEIADMITAFFKELNTHFALYSIPTVESKSDEHISSNFAIVVKDSNQVPDLLTEELKKKYKAKVDQIRDKVEAHFMELKSSDIDKLRSLIKGNIESFNELLKFKYYGTPNDLEGFKYLIRWFVHTLKDTHDLTNLSLLPDAMDEEQEKESDIINEEFTTKLLADVKFTLTKVAVIQKLGIFDKIEENLKDENNSIHTAPPEKIIDVCYHLGLFNREKDGKLNVIRYFKNRKEMPNSASKKANEYLNLIGINQNRK